MDERNIFGDAVRKVYNERKDFIIIGLTGRTGSGCTTVSNILSTKEFKNLNLKYPKNRDFKSNEERKYAILYKYAEENWEFFQVVEIRNIIASFIFENSYKDFINYLEKLNSESNCQIVDYESLVLKLHKLEDSFDYIKGKLDKDSSDEDIIRIYTSTIPIIVRQLKDILSEYKYKYEIQNNLTHETQKVQSQLYTYIFQEFGNNIRSSGNPYINNFNVNKMFAIADRANDVIKLIRKKNKGLKLPTLICIDAIRNPYEAIFFKDRFSAFYLISVNTEDKFRKERLSELNKYEIESLDETEYPSKNLIEQSFYHQNIKACLEISDIHIYNPNESHGRYWFLTEQVLKYVTLMMHPGLVTPTHTERCMQIAYNAKLNSGCLSRQVGAVITDENYSIKSVGWNNVPEGQVACNLRDINNLNSNKDIDSYSNYEINDPEYSDFIKYIICNSLCSDKSKLKGRTFPYCFKDIFNSLEKKNNQVHTRALHAEENAFLQIAKYGGQGLKGGYLFTTASPCELCSKKAFHIGIKKIYYIDPYPGISQKHILDFGNDKSTKPEMVLFYGAIGEAYTSLYSQRMSYKDELELITAVNYRKLKESLDNEKTTAKTEEELLVFTNDKD